MSHYPLGWRACSWKPKNVQSANGPGSPDCPSRLFRALLYERRGRVRRKIRAGKPMAIYGDGRNTRAGYRGDGSMRGHPAADRDPTAYNQVFNIGADTPYSVGFLADVVADAMGVEPNIVHLPAREEVPHSWGDNASCAPC